MTSLSLVPPPDDAPTPAHLTVVPAPTKGRPGRPRTRPLPDPAQQRRDEAARLLAAEIGTGRQWRPMRDTLAAVLPLADENGALPRTLAEVGAQLGTPRQAEALRTRWRRLRQSLLDADLLVRFHPIERIAQETWITPKLAAHAALMGIHVPGCSDAHAVRAYIREAEELLDGSRPDQPATDRADVMRCLAIWRREGGAGMGTITEDGKIHGRFRKDLAELRASGIDLDGREIEDAVTLAAWAGVGMVADYTRAAGIDGGLVEWVRDQLAVWQEASESAAVTRQDLLGELDARPATAAEAREARQDLVRLARILGESRYSPDVETMITEAVRGNGEGNWPQVVEGLWIDMASASEHDEHTAQTLSAHHVLAHALHR